MSRVNRRRLAVVFAILSSAFLMGCGKSNSGNTNVGVVPGGLYPGGPGYASGSCIPIGTPGYGGYAQAAGGSVQVPFTITGFSYYNRKVLAGAIPYQALQYGQVSLGGLVGSPYPNYGYQSVNLTGSGPDGLISMTVTPSAYTGVAPFPNSPSGNANAVGTYTISGQTVQDILDNVARGAIPLSNRGSVCVSNLAFSLNVTTYGQLYNGDVYIYLNGDPHGYVASF